MITIQEVRGALARGYCADANRSKELDSDLLNAQANEIMKLVKDADLRLQKRGSG